jgi:hypothetical protein
VVFDPRSAYGHTQNSALAGQELASKLLGPSPSMGSPAP